MMSATNQRYSALGLLLLAACSSSKPRGSGTTARDALIAGGETSEFGGDSPYCQPARTTPLDRADPTVAPWVARVEGHYELSFAWQREFLTEDITGFQDKTSVSLDVTVLEALDVDFDVFCPAGRRSRQLELEVAVATADGALQGTFWHRVGTAPGPSPTLEQPLSTYLILPYTPPSLDGFTGSLGYGVDLRSQSRRELSAQLVFDGTTVIGSLSPFLAPATGGPPGAGWSPIRGVFPDDGCSYLLSRPLDLDAPLVGFAEETPRALYDRAISLWQSGPIPADFGGTDTVVNISTGEPSQACEGRALALARGAAIGIDVPMRLETGDGKVAFEQNISLSFLPGAAATVNASNWPRVWVPVDEFEQVTGITGVDFGTGEYGSVDFSSSFDLAASTTSGALFVDQWENVDPRDSGYPGLLW
jgi:hypothetical protein